MHEALFYEKKEDNTIQCKLCPNNCIISNTKRGSCGVRENREGKLLSLVYGKLITLSVDPIEKKPLYHFMPFSKTFSIATAGCNFHCLFCQNYNISQASPEDIPSQSFTPKQVIQKVKAANCKSIAYTYIEPSIFYEFLLDCAKEAKKAGIKNIIVTNGYVNKEPAEQLFKYIDAANVDIKAFTEQFYKHYCQGKLQPVLETLKLMKKHKIHVETTTLLIPGHNDDPEDIKAMCVWIKNNLGTNTPIHFSRFHPTYKLLDANPTPLQTMEKAYTIAKEVGLNHVYLGNIATEKVNTLCPQCKTTVIHRTQQKNILKEGKCPQCNTKIIH